MNNNDSDNSNACRTISSPVGPAGVALLLLAGLFPLGVLSLSFSVKTDIAPLQDGAQSSTLRTLDYSSESAERSWERAAVPVAFTSNLSHPNSRRKVKDGGSEDVIPEKISFNLHVRGILSENCYYCHGPDANHREAGLRLDQADAADYVFDIDDPKSSELIQRILAEDPDIQMPPPKSGRVISDRDRRILQRWIEQGAQYEDHWAFVTATKPELPVVRNKAWGRNEIDQFILAKLEQENIQPAPRAASRVIVRRLYLDLVGLPPTVEQVEAFVAAYQGDDEMAIDGLVSDLLDSPHYGERMALPWLDAARYSDSNGFQSDGDRHQWPWRDWVVDAMNSNMPFDQFTVEQLAGDLLAAPTQSQLIATAFNRNHMLNGEGGAIAEEQRNNYVFDRVDTTATTWLGLTMACAQCHDHKYDPITHKDYYSFFAYFNNVDESGGVNHRANRLQCADPFIEMPTGDQQQQLTKINAKIAPVSKQLKDANEEIIEAMKKWEVGFLENPPEEVNRDVFRIARLPFDEREAAELNKLKSYFLSKHSEEPWRSIKKKLTKLEKQRRRIREKITTVMVMRDRDQPRKTHLFDRGEYDKKRDEVQTDVPGFLPKIDDQTQKDRLTLAKWLVNPKNPLVSRVTVNRYWQTFFGMGLVKTSEDFGVQGELPSHPKLLDWLAVDFVENGWDVKRIHRMIVTSETYLQSSRYRADLTDLDPENRLLARSPRFRMPSMLIRDSALYVAGLLNSAIGGRPVYPYQPPGLWKEFSLDRFEYETSEGTSLYRRSLYTFWRRTVAPPNLFDAANRQTCIVKASRTNTPLHALVLLNDPTFVEASCRLARDIMDDTNAGDDKAKLTAGFLRAIGRKPNERELESLKLALGESRDHYHQHNDDAAKLLAIGKSVQVPEDKVAMAELAAYGSVMQIIINTDEFMTRE